MQWSSANSKRLVSYCFRSKQKRNNDSVCLGGVEYSSNCRVGRQRICKYGEYEENNRVLFKRPEDSDAVLFWTYISNDNTNNKRLRLDSVPDKDSSLSILLANITKSIELNLAKNILQYSHTTALDMNMLFRNTGVQSGKLNKANHNV